MPSVDFRTPRLFVDHALHEGAEIALDRNQSNYVGNVMRLKTGDALLVFNGRDGEWHAEINAGKRADGLRVVTRQRAQDALPDVTYAFAPLKHARLDYMVQKAVEMGVSKLLPVITRHTQVTRVNLERMRANVVEAAEQCGLMALAAVEEPQPLARFLETRGKDRLLVFCDEDAEVGDPVTLLRQAGAPGRGTDVLIGPEGGFETSERTILLAQPAIVRLSLGPRILRADTAAVAALAVVQTALGDWAAK